MNLKMKNVKDLLVEVKAILKDAGIEQYYLDAELFMMEVLNFTKVQLFTKDDYELTSEEKVSLLNMVKQRVSNIPTQYILGRCEFMGMNFYVDKNVLIPRPDTEILVERVIDWAKKNKSKSFIDMCTGSGCIAISLAKYLNINGFAVDISKNAIKIAKKNSILNNVDEKIEFIESDLFSSFSNNNNVDIIVSNPPYISSQVVETLMPEVKDNEPRNALDGGINGLDFYVKIARDAVKFLNQGGGIFFEIGYDQGESVSKILKMNNFVDIKVEKDLAGLDRIVWGIKSNV